MVGSGAHVFAVMGYVISHQQPDTDFGGVVTINVITLAATLGEPVERVQAAVDYLCAPDPKSTTPGKEGRRLVKISEFDYQVVNYRKYFAIKNKEQQRESNRARQAKHRAKKSGSKNHGMPLKGETEFVQSLNDGATSEQLDEHITKNLPPALQ